jgi:hypothetical protein
MTTGRIPSVEGGIQPTIIDAAGDLIYGASNDTPAILAIGTAGQVLTVNSGATAPEWGSASAAFSGARVYKDANQSINSGSGTYVTFNQESYDTNSYHDNVTNNQRLTIPTTGYYLIRAVITFAASNTGVRSITIRKNDAQTVMARKRANNGGSGTDLTLHIATVLSLTATDYLRVEAYQDGTGSLNLIGDVNGDALTYFEAIYLGA